MLFELPSGKLICVYHPLFIEPEFSWIETW